MRALKKIENRPLAARGNNIQLFNNIIRQFHEICRRVEFVGRQLLGVLREMVLDKAEQQAQGPLNEFVGRAETKKGADGCHGPLAKEFSQIFFAGKRPLEIIMGRVGDLEQLASDIEHRLQRVLVCRQGRCRTSRNSHNNLFNTIHLEHVENFIGRFTLYRKYLAGCQVND